MTGGGAQQIRLLVLAGTREARHVVSELSRDRRFDLIASLAGATPSPLPLAAPVHSGGFGGAEGLAQFCRERSIDAIIDVTHPFARHISRNAAAASLAAEIPCLAYNRPPWRAEAGDQWHDFDTWQEMVANIPAGTRVFLAGGTASIEVFTKRDDIFLCARALNVSGYANTATTRFLNAMPDADPDAEMALFTEYGIELLCCKNAGGDASVAKIRAARSLGIPIWFLERATTQKDVPNVDFHDSVNSLLQAILKLGAAQ